MSVPDFLSFEEVVAIHEEQLELWGGSDGIRDQGTLDSALGQPGAIYSFVDEADHYDMAAAYAFSISQGQPLIDGNKRTGLNAALAFLELNGAALPREGSELYQAMMAVANGKLTRAGLADVLRTLAR
jgi:death on curing protein